MIISSSEIVDPDIYASNGVLHTVSSLLIPQGALKRTSEKYLLTLNCTGFVELLHSVDLQSMINNSETEYTILAPADDVLELFGGDNSGLPEKGTAELKRFLTYHFIPGKWTPDRFKDGSLIPTALQEVGLDGDNQVLHVEVTPQKGSEEYKSIRFGGVAGVVDYCKPLVHTRKLQANEELRRTTAYYYILIVSPLGASRRSSRNSSAYCRLIFFPRCNFLNIYSGLS